ncbi:molybdopterin-guanine dinucleotide biosynthesis protein B [Nitratifractor salsuginis]|uniref:Molybdopterin-guanine dinucleotide biosynthesis protein B n=1 Tax=Nitratifractor salsuginis (strain DSM 16511 / JCM 12458 / E9I37-1) TaxID=749222 RepID=E6WXU1_NITSE|nr:molybdopterin-guanine dinucleotide biosynthesis protein B [Nitratifractor salsuginis]ADV46348.1 molybdopterin-guanine dinucleotide biosynthesis protein B [Nitratifractor salsuginis DSM 16511]
MEYKAVAFTGPSNSGKTTLIEKIAKKLVPDRAVAIIKHDPSDKARFDREGKDSDRFFKTGAETAVLSPTRTTLFSHRPRTIEEVARLFGEFDLLMVEGLKHFPLPRIGIFRGTIDPDYLDVLQAVAVDQTVPDEELSALPDRIEVLDLNDIDAIIRWIDRHATLLKKD